MEISLADVALTKKVSARWLAVKLLEKDQNRATELSAMLPDTEVLLGDGSDKDVLNAAGLGDMDTFIAATGENETNIMTCMLVKHIVETQGERQHEIKTISQKHLHFYIPNTLVPRSLYSLYHLF